MTHLRKYLNIRYIVLAALGLSAGVVAVVAKETPLVNSAEQTVLASAEGGYCDLSERGVEEAGGNPTAFVSCAGFLE